MSKVSFYLKNVNNAFFFILQNKQNNNINTIKFLF